MKLYAYRGVEPNFGDELNHLVWPRLLPGIFDEDPTTIFLGIGSILFDDHPANAKKIVMGAGFGGYTNLPNINDGSWQIHFVRGPQTASLLGIDPALALADAGILIRTVIDKPKRLPTNVSFMPHLSSLWRGNWHQACELANITLIDPRSDVNHILDQMLASTVVIAEAMHGAIIADALRVPWIAALPLQNMNRMKWLDWTESLGIDYHPVSLHTSSMREFKLTRLTKSRVASKIASVVDESRLSEYAGKIFSELAARRLTNIAKFTPSLSNELRLDNMTDAMLSKVDTFRRSLSS